jgi:DNA-binding SARP family transcriptional activator/tetratricopeptide (TPR) repeat protein
VLTIRLLGAIDVDADGVPITPECGRRTWGLLAWLALHPGLHARGELAARFWPDVLDSSARGSLRSAVWALRRALGPSADVLVATRERVGLDPARLRTDLGDFERLVEAGDLEAALNLVRGPLLAGVEEEWAYEARDDHARTVGTLLGRLARTASERGDTEAAIGWARRRVALDPLDEGAARDLMDRLADAGDRSGALAVFERLRARLRAELGVPVDAATQQVAEQLRSGPATTPARRIPAGSVALVGRAAESGALRAAWRRAAGGNGVLALISGEAGIGKTRLAEELLDHAAAAGVRVAACAALDLGGGAPLAMWAELIRDLVDRLPAPAPTATWPEELARLAPWLPERLGRAPAPERASVAPELARARLFEAAVELVEHAAPVVLLFEDVHAADDASLELAAYVARRIGTVPALLVLTRRPFPRREAVDALVHAVRARHVHTQELELAPLSHRELTDLVQAVAHLDAHAVERVVAAADGNPLLALEAARAVADGAEGPPSGLRPAIRAIMASLEPDARRLAELAAVAGGDLTATEVATFASADTLARAFDTGLFAAREGRFGYHHALLREAAYADLAEPRRAELHGAFAADCDRPAAERAHHLRQAGRGDLAVAELVRAADEAWAVTALDAAAGFLREAIALADGDAEIRLRLAETEAWRGRRDDAHRAFDAAVERLDRRATRPLAEAWLARAKWSRGSLCDPLACREAAQRALALLGELGEERSAAAVEAALSLCWSEAVAGDVSTAERRLDEIASAATGEAAEHDLPFARAHVAVARGDFGAGRTEFAAAAIAAARKGRPELAWAAWINAACAAAALGDFGDALELADRCLDDVRGIGPLELQTLAARAFVLARMARHDEARATSERERDLAARLGNPSLIALAEHDAGLVAFAAGAYEDAAMRLRTALDGAAAVSRPLALLALGEALARVGRADEAEEAVRMTALEPIGPGDFPDALVPRLTRVQGLIAAARGDVELARRRLGEAAAGWQRLVGTSGPAVEGWHATLVDFGRAPVAGLVEPERELAGVERDLAALTTRETAHAERR